VSQKKFTQVALFISAADTQKRRRNYCTPLVDISSSMHSALGLSQSLHQQNKTSCVAWKATHIGRNERSMKPAFLTLANFDYNLTGCSEKRPR